MIRSMMHMQLCHTTDQSGGLDLDTYVPFANITDLITFHSINYHVPLNLVVGHTVEST